MPSQERESLSQIYSIVTVLMSSSTMSQTSEKPAPSNAPATTPPATSSGYYNDVYRDFQRVGQDVRDNREIGDRTMLGRATRRLRLGWKAAKVSTRRFTGR